MSLTSIVLLAVGLMALAGAATAALLVLTFIIGIVVKTI